MRVKRYGVYRLINDLHVIACYCEETESELMSIGICRGQR